METKFQTSFIPKKPTASAIGNMSSVTGMTSGASHPKRGLPPSLFMTLATIVFVVTLLSTAGMFGWKYFLTNQLATLKDQLSTRQREFDIGLIEKLKAVSVKINLGRQLLNSHLAMSEVFDIISRFTTEKTRFTNMDLSIADKGATGIKLALQGYSTSLPAVAFQSDILNRLDQLGLNLIVKNPIISEPSTDGKGIVSFSLTATIDPNPNFLYEKLVNPVVTPPAATSSDGGVSSGDEVPLSGGDTNPFSSN